MPEESSTGERFDPILVQHRRRTLLLECLRKYEGPVALADLADEIAIREHDTDLQSISGEAVKEIYLSLYHRHIPKLADAGIIEYDQEADLVVTHPEVDLETFSPEDGRISD